MTWLTMETAPKDGSEILAATPEGFAIVTWQDFTPDCPDQPGHNAGWASSCWIAVWPGRNASGGFERPDNYWAEPVNQPVRWQPIDAYPDDIDWDAEVAPLIALKESSE